MKPFFQKMLLLSLIFIEYSRQTLLCISGKPKASSQKTEHQNPALPPQANLEDRKNIAIALQAQKLFLQTQSAESHFMNAIKHGDLQNIKFFIEYGVDINAEINGLTPLKVAIAHGQQDALVLLLSLKNPKIKITKEDITQAQLQIELVNAALKASANSNDLIYPHIEKNFFHQTTHHRLQSHTSFQLYRLLATQHHKDQTQANLHGDKNSK